MEVKGVCGGPFSDKLEVEELVTARVRDDVAKYDNYHCNDDTLNWNYSFATKSWLTPDQSHSKKVENVSTQEHCHRYECYEPQVKDVFYYPLLH